MKCAGSGVSKMIYERAGPGLAIETKEHYSVAQVMRFLLVATCLGLWNAYHRLVKRIP